MNSLTAEIPDQEARWEYYRRHLYPYREWIGAQTRADRQGYVIAAAFPERLATGSGLRRRISPCVRGGRKGCRNALSREPDLIGLPGI